MHGSVHMCTMGAGVRRLLIVINDARGERFVLSCRNALYDVNEYFFAVGYSYLIVVIKHICLVIYVH